MKKLKKLIILITIVILVFSIYILFKNDNINYIALGDSLAEGMNPYGEIGYSYTDYLKDYLEDNNKLSYYTKEYTKSGCQTKDLISNLNINNKLKKDLRESNLVTVSIGANDLLYEIRNLKIDVSNILEIKEKVKKIVPNIENSIKEIRKYAKNEIIIVGYYNPVPFLFNTSGSDLDELFAYIDDEYKKIADSYNCKYISLYNLFKTNSNYLPNPNNIHPSLNGYKAIANEVIKNYISKKILEN